MKLRDAVHAVGERMGPGPHLDYNRFLEMVKAEMPRPGGTMTAEAEEAAAGCVGGAG